MSLERWPKVAALREKLNGKAKAEPGFRFYLLYDKMYRMDVLQAAYALCRKNGGAPGVDGVTFEQIEAQGAERFLGELARELKSRTYESNAVRRVMIPKPGKPGEFRPLGIPTIKDRVVQQAAKLLLEPIFEADLPENAYGYRAGKSAHDAVQSVMRGLKAGYQDVVDADLSKYFDTIPHDQLMQAVERRIVDHKMLALIRGWLKAPVHVEDERTGKTRIEGGQATKAGTPQGGVISPLLANIYFRRVLVAWKQFGYDRKYRSRIVNYADDFVILTQGKASAALDAARAVLVRIGLTLNEKKTRICKAPDEEFSFVGFTFGKQYTLEGKAYLGMAVSRKKLQQHRARLRMMTGSSQTQQSAEHLTKKMLPVIRGFWNYFSIGARAQALGTMERYVFARVRRWLKRKHPKGGRWSEQLANIWPDFEATFKRARARKHGLATAGSPRTA
ncbi:MAG: group II intron reverse transcriptase/maturase [Blastocatellia bacterium]|nr:group II intron reverse transcriptase/maturase [Blastocatellia bacterium]